MLFSPLFQVKIIAITLFLLTYFSIVSAFGQTGCTDSSACNFDNSATIDDGSCVLGQWTLFDSSLTLSAEGDAWLRQYVPTQFQNYKAELLFRKTQDGSTSQDFHAQCDGIPNTVTIIKTVDGFVFGGYNEGT